MWFIYSIILKPIDIAQDFVLESGTFSKQYFFAEGTLSQYALALAEEDQYVIDAVMNLYFNIAT